MGRARVDIYQLKCPTCGAALSVFIEIGQDENGEMVLDLKDLNRPVWDDATIEAINKQKEEDSGV